jgi:uncharacterized membrane protein
MTFSNDILIQIAIVILGLCGFAVARHIRNHKTKNTPLVCPIGFDCHAVVHSDYSKFFNVPVELLGMVYYAFISLVYIFFIFTPQVLPSFFIASIVLIPSIAFLFSLYLIGVQIFVLKKGCSWCIISAIISALIFIFSLYMYQGASLLHIFAK